MRGNERAALDSEGENVNMKVHFSDSSGTLCGQESEAVTTYLREVNCEHCLRKLKVMIGWEPTKTRGIVTGQQETSGVAVAAHMRTPSPAKNKYRK